MCWNHSYNYNHCGPCRCWNHCGFNHYYQPSWTNFVQFPVAVSVPVQFSVVPVQPLPQMVIPLELKPGKVQINIEVKRVLTKRRSSRW